MVSESTRLSLYKSLFSLRNEIEIFELAKDMEDRFGPLPLPTQRLVNVALLKRILRKCQVQSIAAKTSRDFELRFHSLKEAQIAKMLEVVSLQPKKYRLSPDYKLFLRIDETFQKDRDEQLQILELLLAALHPLAQNMEVGSPSA